MNSNHSIRFCLFLLLLAIGLPGKAQQGIIGEWTLYKYSAYDYENERFLSFIDSNTYHSITFYSDGIFVKRDGDKYLKGYWKLKRQKNKRPKLKIWIGNQLFIIRPFKREVYSDSLHNERLTLLVENDSIAFGPLGISTLEDVASTYIRRNIDTISPVNHKLAEEYYQKALSMCIGDDCFEAVTYFELANHYHPCYYNYAYRMISIFGTKANFEVARAQLTDGISKDPKNTNLLYQRSLFYFQLNDYMFALNDLNMCILFDNEVDSFYYRRSVVLKTIGYYEEAIDDLTSAIALDSSNTTYYIDRAMIFLTVGEGDKACQDFKLAVSLGYRGWYYKMSECGLKYEEVVKPEIITIERKL